MSRTPRLGFTTRASCLLAAGVTALGCGLLLGIVDLSRAGLLALAVPLLSAVTVLRSRVQITNRRTVEPARVGAGGTATVHLEIANRSRLPSGALMLEDQLPSRLRGHARFVIDGLHSREQRTVSYRMPRLARGRYVVGPLHVRLTDPFHLVDVRRSFSSRAEVVVTPILETVGRTEPPRSLDVGDDAGSHSIGARGADDASTREYRQGDDLRKIHWRSSARTGALMVRQEERPWHGRLTVLLDTRVSAHVRRRSDAGAEGDARRRDSLEWAISAAASAATHAVVTRREVGLLDDPARPAMLPFTDTTRIGDHFAGLSASPRGELTALGPALRTLSRETALLAVLGALDDASLRTLADVHPVGDGTTALAVLIDTAGWGRDPDPAEPVVSPAPVVLHAASVLRAAGWQVVVARHGDGVGETLRRVMTPQGALAMTGASAISSATVAAASAAAAPHAAGPGGVR